MVAALKEVGGNAKLTEFPGGQHYQAPDKTFADNKLWPWLFAQKRSR
jgi:hypothetical protein